MRPNQGIILDGTSLTSDAVFEIAVRRVKVELSADAKAAVQRCETYLHNEVELGSVVYGVTTGFGINADKVIPPSEAAALQRNLLLSHACGVGEPFDENLTRAIMAIRLNTLLAGHSGVRWTTIRLLQAFLNYEIHPVIPSQGSVGASGDLCPLSHMALPLIGEGFVRFRGQQLATTDLYHHPEIQAINRQIESANRLLPDAERAPVIAPIDLTYKEGIGLNNGTTVMVALGVLGVRRSEALLRQALKSVALVFEAIAARRPALDSKIHIVRRHPQQAQVAQILNGFLEGSQWFGVQPSELVQHFPTDLLPPQTDLAHLKTTIAERLQYLQQHLKEVQNLEVELFAEERLLDLESLLALSDLEDFFRPKYCNLLFQFFPQRFGQFILENLPPTAQNQSWQRLIHFAIKKSVPQDAYSVRCVPQVLGASWQAIEHVKEVFERELNAVVDNPLVFLAGQTLPNGEEVEQNEVLSGGNFHGQPLALALDYLKIAIAEIGNLLERQINKLLDGATNDLLPPFLIENSGLHSGLMIPQYTAAAVVSENKVLAHPASVDSIPTSANQEDHVSMGTIAGRQAHEILQNVEKILAIHYFTTFQAVHLRQRQFEALGIGLKPAPATLELLETLENAGCQFLDKDRFLFQDIERIRTWLTQQQQ